MRFGPGEVEEGVLGVKPGDCVSSGVWWRELVPYGGRRMDRYHFSATIPLGVNPRIYKRPLPTRPKYWEEATAIRESKNGEYLTA